MLVMPKILSTIIQKLLKEQLQFGLSQIKANNVYGG